MASDEDRKVRFNDMAASRAWNDQCFNSPTSSTQEILLASLRNENDMLRQQIASVVVREREVRQELDRTRSQHIREMEDLQEHYQRKQVEELSRFGQQVDYSRLEIGEIDKSRTHMQSALKDMQRTKEQLESQNEATNHRVVHCTRWVMKLSERIQKYEKELLPTFKPMGIDFEALKRQRQSEDVSHHRSKDDVQDSNLAGAGTKGSALGSPAVDLEKAIDQLDQDVEMMKMIVDAKVETLSLIRKKLRDENVVLKSELEKTLSKMSMESSVLDKSEQGLAIEKNALRKELEQLQEVYAQEMQKLREQTRDFDDKLLHSHQEAQHFRKLSDQLQRMCQELQAKNEQLHSQLEEDRTSRSHLAAELSANKKQCESLKAELEAVKMAQKFLKVSDSRLPAEKKDLMKMLNQLLSDVNKLKEEKLNLQSQNERLHLALTQQDMSRTGFKTEIQLLADGEISDADLTSKLLRQRLGQRETKENRGGWNANRGLNMPSKERE
eukprot:GILK01004722.1.p1 GENE.GILK01004722.1~~GILK01004722.1.p1  ORF type:complete len:497 (-),score=108.97 GILK01004722.1:123-1613(-)